MVDRIEQEQKFIEAVKLVKSGRKHEVKLRDYFPKEIAAALDSLIQIAVEREREACANRAESVGEPGAAYKKGDKFAADPKRKETCLEVAAAIRARR